MPSSCSEIEKLGSDCFIGDKAVYFMWGNAALGHSLIFGALGGKGTDGLPETLTLEPEV